jgi:PTS system nitrogen regulatory IIA component
MPSSSTTTRESDEVGLPMQLNDIFAPNAVIAALPATSKIQVLRALADAAAGSCELDPQDIFETLREREQLGSTAIGDGVAIPHAKVPGLDRLIGWIARLEEPVDFDAVDDRPVDLVVLLLAPESAGADHLRVLAQLSRLAKDHYRCATLRGCSSAEALWAALVQQDELRAA